MSCVRIVVILLSAVITFQAELVSVEALNVGTHALVNLGAASHAGFHSYLRDQAGFLRGSQASFGEQNAVEWVAEGGEKEDDDLRFLKHFHDPLSDWSTAGLFFIVTRHASSAVWLHDANQEWSWPRARGYFETALTSANPAQREEAWGKTFRAVGQIMHLVADAAVPEHARLDPHPLGAIVGNYEYWVSGQHASSAGTETFRTAYLSSPIEPHPSILQQPTGEPAYPLTVARLIDTKTYKTSRNPNVTKPPAVIGIAEFANANFFSEDTAEFSSYPFPNIETLQPIDIQAPRPPHVRGYFKKADTDGVQVVPVVAECVLHRVASSEGVAHPIVRRCTDQNVWKAVAQLMLPRAVGYSRAALNYFFRGRIEIAAPDRFVYAVAPYADGNAGSFARLKFKIRNATPNESAGTGQVVAVVQYRNPGGDIITNPGRVLPGQTSHKVSRPQTVTLSNEFQEVAFDFASDPIPANATDVFLMVVYKGPLGLETDAVMVGGKDIFEPTPIDIINATDHYCYNGTLYPVADFQQYPPWQPLVQERRDLEPKDHVQDLFGPHDEVGVYMKVGNLFGAPPASTTSFDATVPSRTFAHYTRYMVLVDDLYSASWFIQSLVERGTIPNPSVPNVAFSLPFFPNVNRLVLAPDGSTIHQWLGNFQYRGLVTLNAALLPPQLPQSFVPCVGASFTAQPSLLRTDAPIAEP